MKKLLLAILISLISLFTYSQIINIPNDYPTIQQGIDAALDGDTILVDTGTYVENINFNGKNVTVASYYLTTMDTSFISQTIIDGNQGGCVVVFKNNESQLSKLCGFTIMNGLNNEYWPFGNGGGILTYNSSPKLDNLLVKNNESGQEGGGGIGCIDGSPILTNLTIQDNFASGENSRVGGGVYCNGANATFNNVIITGNTALYGGGVYITHCNPILQDVLISENTAEAQGGGMRLFDASPNLKNVTLKNNIAQIGGGMLVSSTTANPVFDSVERCNIYYNTAETGRDVYSYYPIEIFIDTFSVLYPTEYYLEPLYNFDVDILNGIITQTDADLYVSPNGDNHNNGLTENEPLKTIQNALSIIRADSLHHNKIILLEGVFSPTSTEEHFPIELPDYIDVEGLDANLSIVDAEGEEGIFRITDNISNRLSNITIRGGNHEWTGGGLHVNRSHIILDNILLTNNYSTDMGGGASFWGSEAIINNLVINNNEAIYYGGGIWSYNSSIDITNSLISHNHTSGGGGGLGISLSQANIKNVTLTHNSASDEGGGIYLGGFHSYNNNVYLTNVLLWNDSPNEIAMNRPMYDDPNNDKLYCQYSNIKGGEVNIIPQQNDTIYWLEGNINQDPLFVDSGFHPYQINDYSPCIDAGTPDTTGLNLPEYDLAGELRIFNDRIDMGAYEWNTFVGIEEALLPEKDRLKVDCYPNPFSSSTTIQYELKQPEKVTLTIYDYLGKQVYQTQENQPQGKQQLIWNAKGYAEGVYYYRIKVGDAVANGKMVKVR